ncbi:MAG: hypothetical protein ACREB8_15405 [Pseudolabrys sp.]
MNVAKFMERRQNRLVCRSRAVKVATVRRIRVIPLPAGTPAPPKSTHA